MDSLNVEQLVKVSPPEFPHCNQQCNDVTGFCTGQGQCLRIAGGIVNNGEHKLIAPPALRQWSNQVHCSIGIISALGGFRGVPRWLSSHDRQ